MYEVSIILDSISHAGARITTFQLRFPRFILAEFNTHRQFSRNARSSRAVPFEKLIREIKEEPAGPVFWGRNQAGMKATEELDGPMLAEARFCWDEAARSAAGWAFHLGHCKLHKQLANRVIEPFLWVDVVVTATSYDNFFRQRCHEAAQPEMQVLAVRMAKAYRDSIPNPNDVWHLPYLTPSDSGLSFKDKLRVSVARTARVSYRAFDGSVASLEDDIRLHDQLLESGHWSPFEHQAMAAFNPRLTSGNFRGWLQHRQTVQPPIEPFDFATLSRFGERGFAV